MSGVMLKTAVYGFVRFVFDFLSGGPWWSGYVVLLVAAVTGLLGILYALAENDLKRLLAYSSVENVGIIFLGLGTSMIFLAHSAPVWAGLALAGALLHAFNHAMFKSLLFLGSGARKRLRPWIWRNLVDFRVECQLPALPCLWLVAPLLACRSLMASSVNGLSSEAFSLVQC